MPATPLEPVTPLLSVPFSNVFRILPEDVTHDEDGSNLYWAASMAWKLLREKAKGQSSKWQQWIASLPNKESMNMPICWTQDEVKLLGDPFTIRELLAQQQAYLDFWLIKEERGEEEIAATMAATSYDEFMWAVQCVLSRSFYDPAHGHLIVPAVDMCNHAFRPTAAVSVKNGGKSSQGSDALDEVCDSTLISSEPSLFCLTSSPRPILQGEEVTISYGSWTNEVFLLLFGFIPPSNPNDIMILFPCLLDLACCLLAISTGIEVTDDLEEEVSEMLSGSDEVMKKASNFNQLIMTGEGCDGRLEPAFELARSALGLDSSLSPERFISMAANSRLKALMKVDSIDISGLRPAAISLAEAYRRSKVEIVKAYLNLNWEA